jgi:hypothetical protein
MSDQELQELQDEFARLRSMEHPSQALRSRRR